MKARIARLLGPVAAALFFAGGLAAGAGFAFTLVGASLALFAGTLAGWLMMRKERSD